MNFKALTIIFLLLLAGGPSVVPAQEVSTAGSAKEGQPPEKPVMLDDQVLFYIATEAEGYSMGKRAKEISKRIKKIADAPQFIAL